MLGGIGHTLKMAAIVGAAAYAADYLVGSFGGAVFKQSDGSGGPLPLNPITSYAVKGLAIALALKMVKKVVS